MLQAKPIQTGSLMGTIYDFEKAGDVLPLHTHDAQTVHVTIVARGSVKITGDGWEMTGKTGDFIDFIPGQEHEFVALEDNSRIVNIIKGSLPTPDA